MSTKEKYKGIADRIMRAIEALEPSAD